MLVCEEQVSPDLLDEISKHISTKNTRTKSKSISHKLVFDTLDELLCQQDEPKTAWLISSNVYYNAAAYQQQHQSMKIRLLLMVLAPFLRNGYLHGAIREKGGAYGSGASFDSNAAAFRFYSHRDPDSRAKTLHTF